MDDNAVSELIGEILMTAIAVLAFSVMAVFVFSSLGAEEKIHANIDGWVDTGSSTIHIRHAGGEDIDLNKVELILNLNGTRRELSSFQLVQLFGSESWHLGEIIVIYTDAQWSTTLGEDDYIGMILLQTDSRNILVSGSLLGDEIGMDSGSDTGSGSPGSDRSYNNGNIAWWKFNEGSGTIATDSIGVYHGGISGAGWTTGVSGSALVFDGSNDRVEVNERIIDGYPFTISVWVKTTDSGSSQAVVNLADSGFPNSYYGIYITSSGNAAMLARNPSTSTITGFRINDGGWYNVVAVFNSSTERRLYVNGAINGTQTSTVTFRTSSDRWSVGRWGDSSPSAYFDGIIDEVRLWNRGLNVSEVLELYDDYA